MTTNLLWAWTLPVYVLTGPEGIFSTVALMGSLLWVFIWHRYSLRRFFEYCLYSVLPILFEIFFLALAGLIHDRDYRLYMQIFLGFSAVVSTGLIIVSGRNIGVRFPGLVIILAQIYSTAWALFVAGMRITDSWL
jgi:hypothetical protein